MAADSKYIIAHHVHINQSKAEKDNTPLLSSTQALKPEEWYQQLQRPYLKFFKMDVLCKWAWLGAEYLLSDGTNVLYDGLDKTRIGVVLSTNHGCIDVDKRYQETIATIPSPALFVYTLPNIMLGEICIRHGIKGEQLSLISEMPDFAELHFWADDLLTNKGMDACLCGWVDATGDTSDVFLFWVAKNGGGIAFTPQNLAQLYSR
ncbi:hypothetical protein ACTHGU_13675 [Chitinophagaceae bacterium MMS25-I14]